MVATILVLLVVLALWSMREHSQLHQRWVDGYNLAMHHKRHSYTLTSFERHDCHPKFLEGYDVAMENSNADKL